VSGTPPRVGAVTITAAAAALAGSVAAAGLLGARPAFTPVALALDLVCAATAALAWRAAREPGSVWRDVARSARNHPLLAAWVAADLTLVLAASAAGFGKLDAEPVHWKAIAIYVAVRAALLSLKVSGGLRSRKPAVGGVAVIFGVAGVALALFSPPLWRAASSAGALAMGTVALALGREALHRLAPAAIAALPALALAAAAWLSGTVALAWASPVASASMLLALGLAALVIGDGGRGGELSPPGGEGVPPARA